MKRIYFGVGLITFATLLLELLFTRIFSVTLYYHFAFMVISVALFGLGLSGVVLYLQQDLFSKEKLYDLLSANSRRFAGASILAAVFILNHSVSAHFSATEGSHFTWQSFFELSFLYVFSAIPFYYSGMVVSLALFHLRQKAATVYFYDLVGASLACLFLDQTLQILGAPNAVLATAIIISLAAIVFEEKDRWKSRSFVVCVGIVCLFVINIFVGALDVGSFKWVRKEFLAFSKWNAFSRIEVQERSGERPDMTIDSMARTEIVSLRDNRPPPIGYEVSTLVHVIRSSGKMLIIGPGGGVDVLNALRRGHQDITLAEINPIIINDVMRGRYAKYSGNLFDQPQVKPVLSEGRSFVRRSKQKFDVILATLVDTWAATASGAFALTENHLYTVEAFKEYLTHLTDNGILTMTRWVQVPGMEFVRLASLAKTSLIQAGIKEPYRHSFAAYKGPLGTLLVKKTPFSEEELTRLHKECDIRGLKILYSPREKSNNPIWHILGPKDPSSFYAAFPIDVRPVYDDRPFFFYSIKPEHMFKSIFVSGTGEALNNFSLQVLAGLTVLVLLFVVLGIVVPLWMRQRRRLMENTGSKIRDLFYFVCLGIGFILIEVGFLQQFALHLGHPTYSLQVVLFSMLFFGGIGSLVSGRVKSYRGMLIQMSIAAGGTSLLMFVYSFNLGSFLNFAIGWSLYVRILMAIGLVAMPAFLMGMMLPTGIRMVSFRHDKIIPWAWGLNGAASVLGSVLAMAVALHLGFSMTLLLGGGVYFIALLVGFRRIGPTTVSEGLAPNRSDQ